MQHLRDDREALDKITDAKSTREIQEIEREAGELARRRQVLEDMPPRLREKCDSLRRFLEQEVRLTLWRYYEVGLRVLEIYLDETENGARVYGRNALDHVCRVLDWDQGLLRSCLRFAQAFTRAQVEALCGMRLPHGEPLTWSHVRCVLGVEDPDRRDQLLREAAARGLTCSELAYRARRPEGERVGDGRGRPVKVAGDVLLLAQQQGQFLESWEKRYQKVWADPMQSFLARARELSPEAVTEEHLVQALDLAERLRLMAEQAVRAASQAEAAADHFEQVLEQRRIAAGVDPGPGRGEGVAAEDAGTARGPELFQ